MQNVKTVPEMENLSKIILERTPIERQRFFISDLWRITTRTFELRHAVDSGVFVYLYSLCSTFLIIELKNNHNRNTLFWLVKE